MLKNNKLNENKSKNKNNLGQYFTTDIILKEKIYEFILNDPSNILEPSIGQGDLVEYIINKNKNIIFDMYEIDMNIKLLSNIERNKVIYGDFIEQIINKKYKTIIGNPPYIRTKKGNLYIDFTKKCYDLLEINGELIFIVPSDFFKLTSSYKLLNEMMTHGTFTHIFHPHNEKMFHGASIDIIIFRYCKNKYLDHTILYNDNILYTINSNGLITFENEKNNDTIMFQDIFDIYVGLVSGKEDIYKNNEIGNRIILNGENKFEKYIFIDKYPCENEKINSYLINHKKTLITRSIRKFNEENWFEWGAPRNISIINNNFGKDCIYIYCLTRRENVSFVSTINYFGAGLIMLKPKKEYNLINICSYLNSSKFKEKFIFSGRFKIGHRQISNSYISADYL